MRSAQKFPFGITALVCMMVVLLVACGSNNSSPTTGSTPSTGQKATPEKQVFNWPIVGVADIKTFDPAMTTTQVSSQAIRMVFTGLLSLDEELNVKPQLAQSYKQGEDGITWTFNMKPNLKFSDGSPLNSKDVAYSLNRALSKDLGSPAAPSYLNLIQDADKMIKGETQSLIGSSIVTPDDHTIIIKTNKPAAYFPAALTYDTSFVVQKKLIDKYGNAQWTDHLNEGGGAGPFKVQQYAHGRQIVFVHNENYYGPKPQLTKVVMPFIKDVETAYRNYQTGAIDQVGVPTAHLEQAMKSPEYHRVPVLSTYSYNLNMLAKPFDNLKIRQAFALALNKDAIVKAVYKGVYTPSNHIVPEGMPGFNPDLKGPDGEEGTAGNVEAAKRLFQEGLREGGYASVAQLPPIKLTYPSGSTDTDNQVAVSIQQWKSVLGVNVKATPMDFETLSAAQPKTVGNDSLQFFYAGWGADYPDPQNFLTLQFSKGSPNNATNYGQNRSPQAPAQQQVQQRLQQADVMTDDVARLKAYNDAEQQLVNDVAWLPLFQLARSRLLKSYVVGRTFNAADMTPANSWSNVYIMTH